MHRQARAHGCRGGFRFPLRRPRRRQLERRLRGREQVPKLRRADAVVVSYGKAGRTWLRVMLSRYYQHLCGLPARTCSASTTSTGATPRDPAHLLHPRQLHPGLHRPPRLQARLLRQEGRAAGAQPQDVAVSQYFQWKHRMRPREEGAERVPGARRGGLGLRLRRCGPSAGLPKIIEFMNLLGRRGAARARAAAGPLRGHAARPAGELRRHRALHRRRATDEAALRHAVEYASVENMRAMEQRNVFWLSGGRMTPRDRSNPDSYKVRRAKVGGYRDYFDDEQVARMDELVRSKLSPLYGYGGEAAALGAGATKRRRVVKPCVFIHSNDRQRVGALVAAHALRRNSQHPDDFDVRIIQREDYAFFAAREGQRYLRDGSWRVVAQRRSPVVHAAALHAAGADGLPGSRARDRPRHLRGRRRHASCSRATWPGKAILCRRRAGWKKKTLLRIERHAARLRAAARTGAARRTSASSSRASATTADWICLRLEPPDRSGRSRTSGTISTA